MKINKDFLENLKNFSCFCDKEANLIINQEYISCEKCQNKFFVKDNKIYFVDNYINKKNWDGENTNYLEREKNFSIPDYISGPRIKNLRAHLNIKDKSFSINFGGGNNKIDKFINVDIGNYENVNVVASLTNLPIKSSSVDLIVSNSVLEHIKDYKKAVSEAKRILKPGGYFYLCTPLLSPKHHPIDYTRWTIDGLKNMFENEKYNIVEEGVCRSQIYTLFYILESLITLKTKKGFPRAVFRKILKFILSPLFKIKNKNTDLEKAYANTVYIIIKKNEI